MDPSIVRLVEGVTWKAEPCGSFLAFAPTLEMRLGPPTHRDCESNGVGLFDCHCLRFACGLEVSLWRFHIRFLDGRRIDTTVEPAGFQIHANQPGLAHVAHHLGVAIEDIRKATDEPELDARFVVMRQDDNGNRFEVRRVSSSCEAAAIVGDLEAQAHKQTYWFI
jgi:hypothetical protein